MCILRRNVCLCVLSIFLLDYLSFIEFFIDSGCNTVYSALTSGKIIQEIKCLFNVVLSFGPLHWYANFTTNFSLSLFLFLFLDLSVQRLVNGIDLKELVLDFTDFFSYC